MAKSTDKRTRNNKTKRLVALSIAIIIGLAVNTGIFINTLNNQNNKLERYFEFGVSQRMSAIERSIENKELTMLALQNHLLSIQSREDFTAFTTPFLDQITGIQALEWVPRVPSSDRNRFIQEALSDGYSDFDFTAVNNQGDRVSAPLKDEYYPVYFVEPFEGNQAALGFDLSSNPRRLTTLNLAIESGQPHSTGRINLIQAQETQAGILTFFPIYTGTPETMTLQERKDSILGFALGVFIVPDLIDIPIESFENDLIDIYVTDITEPNQPEELHYHNPALNEDNYNQAYYTSLPGTLHRVETLRIGSRTWQLTFVPTPMFISTYKTLFPYLLLGIGLLVMSVLIAYYNMTLTRTITIKNLVTEKTKALELTKAEAVKSGEMAKQANKSKTEFLTNISHELRTPLNGVLGISNTLLKNRTANLDDSQLRGLTMIQKSGLRILDLINDILDLEKIESGNVRFNARPVRLKGLLDYAEHIFKGLMEVRVANREDPLDLYMVSESKLPEFIHSDRKMLEQVIENLMKYSTGYTSKGSVTLKVNVVESSIWFEFTNTGAGISEKEKPFVFDRFHKLAGSSKSYDDSGLGLFMAKSLVHMMGGELKAISDGQNGSTMRMSFLVRIDENELLEPFEKHTPKEQYQPFGTKQTKTPNQLHSSLAKLKQALTHANEDTRPTQVFTYNEINYTEKHNILNNKTVLLCSDNDALHQDLKNCVKKYDIQHIEAKTGTQAIEMLEDFYPDIIIIDGAIQDSSPESLINIFQILRAETIQTYLIIDQHSQVYEGLDVPYIVIEPPFDGTTYINALAELIESKIKALDSNISKHILIADDEMVGRELLRMILEKKYTLTFAQNGKEALQLYTEEKPDLVLMDIMMPEMDGIEALNHITEQDPDHVPIVALTAKALQEEEETLLRSGFDGYISKPFKADKLMDMIDVYFDPSASDEA